MMSRVNTDPVKLSLLLSGLESVLFSELEHFKSRHILQLGLLIGVVLRLHILDRKNLAELFFLQVQHWFGFRVFLLDWLPYHG